MCTVTYLPYREGFVLTHNRDEAPSRSTQHIKRGRAGAQTLLFPQDSKAGGTWIATARSGRTACLLNGAFIKHKHQPPYRRSRGLILLDFFAAPDPDAFLRDCDLEGIEPFTLLFFAPGRVVELRWDGAQRHLLELDPAAAHFWCSATLYPPEMQEKREAVFRHWLAKRAPQSARRLPADILYLHRTGSVGDPENDYVMDRSGRVQTVSITQIVQSHKGARMRYDTILEASNAQRRLSFELHK
jgi:hypothetical protein